MLSLFLLHIVISLLCLCSGFLFYQFIDKDKNSQREYKPVIFYLVMGLISFTLVSQIIILFLPLKGYWLPGLSIVLAFLLSIQRKPFAEFISHVLYETRRTGVLPFAIIFIAWLLILILNAGPTIMDDTESYHIQNVKWIKEFGTVPGLVHLHERFAFNSSWFTSVALFDFIPGQLNYFTALNGVLSLWLVSCLVTTIAQKNNLSIAAMILFLICMVSWPLIRGNAATANYDHITALIIFILFFETVKSSAAGKTVTVTIEWLIWPAYLFTVRIVNFPMLLLSLIAIIYLLKQKQYRRIVSCSIVCILLVLPFLARNVMLSGYPFYPSLSFDLFSVDWKADPELTKEVLRYIKYYNRVNTGFLPLETTEAMAFPQWIKAWFKYMFTFDKIIFIPAIIGLLSFPWLVKKNKFLLSPVIKWLTGIIMVQLISWFFIAPDPRFAYGCLFTGALLFSILLTSFISHTALEKLRFPALAFALIVVSGFTIFKFVTQKPLPNSIYAYRLPQPPVREIIVDNITLRIPEKILDNWNPRCYATELPCIYVADPRLRARGKSISDGFRLEK